MGFIKSQKGKQNLHLRVTCTLWIEKLGLKHNGSVKVVHFEQTNFKNSRYEH